MELQYRAKVELEQPVFATLIPQMPQYPAHTRTKLNPTTSNAGIFRTGTLNPKP